MPNNSINYSKVDSDTSHSIIYWIMSVLVIFFLFNAPFHTGLFNGYSAQYEGAIFSSILGSSFLLLALAVHFFTNWKLHDYRDLLGLLIWTVPLTFWISSLQAASPHLASNMTKIHVMYAIFFIAGLYIARNNIGAAVIQYAITLSGYAVVFYGIANMFGNAHFRDAVMLTDQGYRLTSVFQYANAYAAFLMALLLCCLYYISTSTRWYISALHAFMLIPISVSFWLTLSRGGIVTLPFIFLIVLPLLPLARQLVFSVYAGIGMLIAFPIMDILTDKSTNIVKQVWATIDQKAVNPDKTAQTLSFFSSESISGWGLIVGLSLLVVLIITLIQKFILPILEQKLSKLNQRSISKIAFPLLIVVLSSILVFLLLGTGVKHMLPDTLEKRLESINFQTHSVLERATFYKDSLKVIKDYPLLGTGGGGWAALYESYQNNPYTSRQAHNFFLQYLVEVGVIGFICLLAIILMILLPIYKQLFKSTAPIHSYAIFFFISITLLIHSSLDFEMSYVYLGALVFLSLGGLGANLEYGLKWASKLHNNHWIRYGIPGLVGVVAIAFFYNSLIDSQANRNYNKALTNAKTQQPLQEITAPMDKALKSRPDHPDYLLFKASIMSQLYSQTKDDKYYREFAALVGKAKKHEPNNRSIIDTEINLHLQKNELLIAHQLVIQALKQYPWEINFYTPAATIGMNLWDQARVESNTTVMNQYEQQLNELFTVINKKLEHLQTLPKEQLQGRPFYMPPAVPLSIGQIHFIKGNMDQAITYLKQSAGSIKLDGTEDANQERNIARWYLAALAKTNQKDEALYNKIVAKWPEEAQEIEKLSKTTF